MAKMNLMENEVLLGTEPASHIKKFLFLPQSNPGKLSVSTMRVFFEPTQGDASSAFAYSITDISSFSVGMANTITLMAKDHTHKITGMFNKKLIGHLEAAGVKRTS